MNKQPYNYSGFTLIEVLVSIGIFSVVMAILFSSFRAFVFSSETASDMIRSNEMIRSASSMIHRDLSSIFSLQKPRYKEPSFNFEPDPFRLEGGRESVSGRTVSFISFASTSHAVLGRDRRRGISRISYYAKQTSGGNLNLYRSDQLIPVKEDKEHCADPILIEDISGFEIVYIDKNGNQYEEWSSENELFKYAYPDEIMIRVGTGQDDSLKIHLISSGLYSGRRPVD